MTWITPARLGLGSALCLIAAAVLALSDDAQAALRRQPDAFDARSEAGDSWGLVDLCATEPSLAID